MSSRWNLTRIIIWKFRSSNGIASIAISLAIQGAILSIIIEESTSWKFTAKLLDTNQFKTRKITFKGLAFVPDILRPQGYYRSLQGHWRCRKYINLPWKPHNRCQPEGNHSGLEMQGRPLLHKWSAIQICHRSTNRISDEKEKNPKKSEKNRKNS